jgi:hypothetical protein
MGEGGGEGVIQVSASAMQIESLLDESTAELAKMEFTPLLSTIEANFKLKKSVPLHTTLRIDCKVDNSLLHFPNLLYKC